MRLFSCAACGDPNPEWFGGHSSRKIYRCNRCPGNAAHPKRHPCIIVACPESSPPRNCPWSDFPPQWVAVDSLTEGA